MGEGGGGDFEGGSIQIWDLCKSKGSTQISKTNGGVQFFAK